VKRFQAAGYVLDRRAYRRCAEEERDKIGASCCIIATKQNKTVAFMYVKDSCCLYGL